MDNTILIDYENVQNIELGKIDKSRYRILVFIGQLQYKIPFEFVKEAQSFGDALEWIKIDGNGPNALDFHIAFYLGQLTTEKKKTTYIILSKDKGFDPLISFMNKREIKCRRINSLIELSNSQTTEHHKDEYEKIIENLKKIEKAKRPRKRKTLKQHINNTLGKNTEERLVEEIVDRLFIDQFISEENGKLIYS